MHLSNVCLIGADIFQRKKLNFKLFSHEELKKLNEIILLTHDVGKAISYFQEYMTDIQDEKDIIRYKGKEIKAHGLISGILSFEIAKTCVKNEVLPFIAFIAVARHHNDLDNFMHYFSMFSDEVNQKLIQQFKSIDKTELQCVLRKIGINFDMENYTIDTFQKDIALLSGCTYRNKAKANLRNLETFLLINFLFSILTFSDKLEAILYSQNENLELFLKQMGEKNEIPSNLVEDYKSGLSIKNIEMVAWRDEIYADVVESTVDLNLDNKILSINLPTGAGKTLTALKSSLILKERLKKEREIEAKIIYVLPYTSIIEQNYDVFKAVFKTEDNRILMKHHHLSGRVYQYEKDQTLEEFDGGVGEHLIETWESEVVVSTFVQLLHSILTNKNKQLKKFHNIANSIIILDEVQNIPQRYWKLIHHIFKQMADNLNCYFIFMTATMPMIFSEEEREIYELAKNKAKYFLKFNRVNINTSLLKTTMNLDSFKSLLSNHIRDAENKSFLIVVNTIKSSTELYQYLKNTFQRDEQVYYLSTNIIPRDRLDRIRSIKRKEDGKRRIIVSTQMIEAGVDIDIDIVYRDIGPMDSINQTAGRCNREGVAAKGEVFLVQLVDDKNNEKKYSDYVYDFILMDSTNKVLKDKEIIEEKDIFQLSKAYFDLLKKYSKTDESNSILSSVIGLDYKDAFVASSGSGKNKNAFELIEQDFKTVDVFIEIDENAISIWEKYNLILKIKNQFERKKEFNKIKKDLYQFIVSVPERVFKKHLDISENQLNRISKEMLSTIYSKETGFIRNDIPDYIY